MKIEININDEHLDLIKESIDALLDQNLTIEGDFKMLNFKIDSVENETDENKVNRVMKELFLTIVGVYKKYKEEERYKQEIEAVSKPNPVIPNDLII